MIGYGNGVGLSPNIASLSSYDASAALFFAATGITDITQKSAVNTLVLDLKAANLWTKFYFAYPYVGGTATTNKYNIINTAQYAIDWFGGMTHTNGAQGNGSNGYGDTNFNGTGILNVDDVAMHVYSCTNADGSMVDAGVFDTGSFSRTELFTRSGGNAQAFTASAGAVTAAVANSVGTYTQTRVGTSTSELYKGGVSLGTAGSGGDYIQNYNFFSNARSQDGVAGVFSSRNLGFFGLSTKFNAAQALALDTILTTYNTSLSR